VPQALIAALPLIFSGVGAATALGTGIYSAVNQPGQPQQPAPPTAAQNVQAEVNKRSQEAQIVNRQIPDLIANTSGGLSDQAYQTGGSSAAGIPGTFGAGGIDLNQIMTLLGGGNNQPPTDLVSLASGNITGGY
jgi:hypothetical protein